MRQIVINSKRRCQGSPAYNQKNHSLRQRMFCYLHCGLAVYPLEESFPNSAVSTQIMAEETNIQALAAQKSTMQKHHHACLKQSHAFRSLLPSVFALFLYVYGSHSHLRAPKCTVCQTHFSADLLIIILLYSCDRIMVQLSSSCV